MHIRPGVAQWLAARFDLSAKDVRADAGFALAYASEAGRLRHARWLADHFELTPADARADDNCALAYASMWGHQEIARWLIVRFGRPINNGRGSFIKVHVREYGYRKLADWMEAVAGSF